MQWFRMYAEAVDDDKLRLLAFEDRWHFVALLCLKAGDVLDSDPSTLERRIGIKLGLMPADLAEVKRRLLEVRLIDDNWQPSGWKRRQFQSDMSTERTRKWRRNRKRSRNVTGTSQERSGDDAETFPKRHGNGPDTEQNRTEQRQRTRKARSSRVPAEFLPDLEFAKQEIPDIDAEREAQRFRDHEFRVPRADWAAVWRTWIGNCRDTGRYARQENGGWR